jgi:phage/plasmid-associated DNA primase
LEEILPDKDDREYLLIYMASGLIGINVCELFTILTGKGRNGKSKFVDLVALTFGDYFGRPKCKLLTGTRPDENSPEPGLLSLKKKRTIIVTEPEKSDKLNSGFIKFMTGNDSETLRKCHKNEMEIFKANFITFLVCNDIPEIDNIDIAFAKRLRCINFPTEFIQNPKLEHQKKIDETLQLKIPLWKNDFLILLLEYYNKFKNGFLQPSKNVLEWTEMYKEEADKYLIFLNETTENSEKHISNVILFNAFKFWFRDKYPGEKIPNNRDFLNGIKKHKNIEKCIKINGKNTTGIKNMQLINNDDEFDS